MKKDYYAIPVISGGVLDYKNFFVSEDIKELAITIESQFDGYDLLNPDDDTIRKYTEFSGLKIKRWTDVEVGRFHKAYAKA